MLVSAQSGLSWILLCSRAGLQSEVEHLQQGKAAAISAEATALRKLERDIHDGPQQRLVRLSIDLGRAAHQIEQDPKAAQTIIQGSIVQAREALDELRALSRGIAPPILVDRGLVAALQEAAGRSTAAVTLNVQNCDGLPEAVESAIYFVVSEALTNVAKHSGANAVEILVHRDDERVLVSVSDNGIGGADLAKGRGLAGLAERLRSLDGSLAIHSPSGGPTTLTAEVPCGS